MRSRAHQILRAAFGDDGVIYAVTTAGDLLWFKHTSRNGTTRWANRGKGRIIGTGWAQFSHVFGGGGGVIYTVEPKGELWWHRHLARGGKARWANRGEGRRNGTGWDKFAQVFSGGGGIIYATTPRGELFWHQHLARDGKARWANRGEGRRIGTGWDRFAQVFSGGGGVIYAITPRGKLFWYRHLSRQGAPRWANRGRSRRIGTGWNKFAHVFSGGRGIIYAIKSTGELLRYEHLSRGGGAPDWANRGVGQQIGAGFNAVAIEGYAVPLGAAPGKKITFRMSTTAAQYTVTYLRLRPAAGAPGVPVRPPFTRPGRYQAAPANAWRQGCGWQTDFTLKIPKAWRSGLYAAQCSDTNGYTFHVVFIVKPKPRRKGDFAVLANTNTWTAYNAWGGRSQYTDPNGRILSLERPNPATSPVEVDGINHLTRAEVWVLDWLRESGYRVDVYADLDFHRGIGGLRRYKAVILNTHPEYWTMRMVDRLLKYLDHGGKLLYLGGNGIYERVDVLRRSRLKFRDRNNQRWLFRIQNPPRSERALLGVAYEVWNYSGERAEFAPYRVEQPSHRFFQGTGLHYGDLIGPAGLNGAASGWEMDTSDQLPVPPHHPGAAPTNICILARGTNTGPTVDPAYSTYSAHMTYYDTPSGGFVFSVGSLTFGGSLGQDPHLQKIVRNVLDECSSS